MSRTYYATHVWTCGERGAEGAGVRGEGTRRRVAVCQECGRELRTPILPGTSEAAGCGTPEVGQAADGGRLAMDWIGLGWKLVV